MSKAVTGCNTRDPGGTSPRKAHSAIDRQLSEGAAAYGRADYQTAWSIWLPLADCGISEAEFNIGMMHASGAGVAKDDILASAWYRRAADQGLTVALFCLGVAYANGHGVANDDKEALRLLRIAAEQGHDDARFELATLLTGEDAKFFYSAWADSGSADRYFRVGMAYADNDDWPEALQWLYHAAAQGHTEAQFKVGEFYVNGDDEAGWGDGTDQWEIDEALDWLGKAAEQGHVEAQLILGQLYSSCEFVPGDRAEAVKWYGLAAAQGSTDGQVALQELLDEIVEEEGCDASRESPRAHEEDCAARPVGASDIKSWHYPFLNFREVEKVRKDYDRAAWCGGQNGGTKRRPSASADSGAPGKPDDKCAPNASFDEFADEFVGIVTKVRARSSSSDVAADGAPTADVPAGDCGGEGHAGMSSQHACGQRPPGQRAPLPPGFVYWGDRKSG